MPDRAKELVDSYLDHIVIAVHAADRGAPFRDFLDNWNAFRSDHAHHRSRGDRPRWFNNPSALSRVQMFDTLDFRSTGASAILAEAARDSAAYQNARNTRDPSSRLVIDHAVPISVMVETLFSGAIDLTREGISDYLTATYRLGLLSHAEDVHLNSVGLRSTMPAGWDGKNLYARYDAAEIIHFALPS